MSRIAFVVATGLISCMFVFGQANMKAPVPNEKKQAPPAAQPVPKAPVNQPVVGKAGAHFKALDTSTTASTGVETPGPETTNGQMQQPDGHGNINPNNPSPYFAAGPNWEQVGQTEELANGNAAAAYRAEIDGPEGTLGVSGTPRYSNPNQPVSKPATRTNQAKPALPPSNERQSNGQGKQSSGQAKGKSGTAK